MSFLKRPEVPDPMQTARAQQGFNRESLVDAIGASQIGQTTPWGNISYTGQVGSPNRQMHQTLNPQDQQRLDQHRQIKGGMLGTLLGQGGAQAAGKAGRPQNMPSIRTPPFMPPGGGE